MEEDIRCYICYEQETPATPYANNPRPCQCKGSIEIHESCLKNVVRTGHDCSICKKKYTLAYLPQRDGRELITKNLTTNYTIEYTINEYEQIHGSYIVKNGDGQPILYHSYINGVMEGPYIHYYASGKIHCVCRCKNDKIDGEYTEFYEDGSIKEELNYKDGKKHGQCIYWKRDGFTRISKEVEYVDGEPMNDEEDLCEFMGECNA